MRVKETTGVTVEETDYEILKDTPNVTFQETNDVEDQRTAFVKVEETA